MGARAIVEAGAVIEAVMRLLAQPLGEVELALAEAVCPVRAGKR